MNCPNIRSQEWKDLLNAVNGNEVRAYSLYVRNNYDIPTVDEIDSIQPESLSFSRDSEALRNITRAREEAINAFANLYHLSNFNDPIKKEDYRNRIVEALNNFKNLSIESQFISSYTFLRKGVDFMQGKMNQKYDLDNLQFMNNFIKAYDVIAVMGFEIDRFKELLSEENKELPKLYETLISDLGKLKKDYLFYSRKTLAELLGKQSTAVRTRYKEKYKIEFRNKHKLSLANMTSSEKEKALKNYETNKALYVQEQLNLNEEQISEEEILSMEQILLTSPKDIGDFERYVADQRNYRTPLLQVAAKLLDNAEAEADRKFLIIHDAEVNFYNEFIKKRRTTLGTLTITNQVELYGDILERDSEGNLTGYMVKENGINNSYYQQVQKMFKEYDNLKITKGQEIADYFLLNWKKENLVGKVKPNGITSYPNILIPKQDQVKPQHRNVQHSKLSGELLEMYSRLRTMREASDKKVYPKMRLGYKLPSINKGEGEQLSQNGVIEGSKEIWKQWWGNTPGNPEYGNNQDTTVLSVEGKKTKRLVDASGNVVKTISIPFRDKIPTSRQSYDLMGMELSNTYVSINYQEKEKVKIQLETIKYLIETKGGMQIAQYNGINKIYKKVVKTPTTFQDAEEQVLAEALSSNMYKAFEHMLNNRLYGEHSKHVEIFGIDANKVADGLIKHSAIMMLGFNIAGATNNLIVGKTMNFLQSFAGIHYSLKDLTRAELIFDKEFINGDLLKDWETRVPKAKVNIFLRKFLDSSMSFNFMYNELIADSAVKRTLKLENITALQTMGEKYIQGTIMYAIMHNKKIMKDGKYIDKSGNVVENRDDAATILDFYNKEGEFEAPKGYTWEGFKEFDKTKCENYLRRVIKDSIRDIQSQQDSRNKSYAETHFLLKLVMFLRRWMFPLYQKHFLGFGSMTSDYVTNYNEAQEEYKEGVFTSVARLLRLLGRSIMEIKQYGSLKESIEANVNWKERSDLEISNVKFATAEVGVFLLAMLLAYLTVPDDDEVLTEEEEAMRYAMAYHSLRLKSELGQFVPNLGLVSSLMRTANTPSATLNTVSSVFNFVTQLGEPFEVYQSGKHIDESKLWVKGNRAFNPFYKIDDFKYKDSYNYLKNGDKYGK